MDAPAGINLPKWDTLNPRNLSKWEITPQRSIYEHEQAAVAYRNIVYLLQHKLQTTSSG